MFVLGGSWCNVFCVFCWFKVCLFFSVYMCCMRLSVYGVFCAGDLCVGVAAVVEVACVCACFLLFSMCVCMWFSGVCFCVCLFICLCVGDRCVLFLCLDVFVVWGWLGFVVFVRGCRALVASLVCVCSCFC